jgi:hypothetical protein
MTTWKCAVALFALLAHAGRLAVTWDHSARGDLKRCP